VRNSTNGAGVTCGIGTSPPHAGPGTAVKVSGKEGTRREVRFYLFINPEHPAGSDPRQGLAGHVRQVELARRAGFQGVAAGQHLSTEGMQWFPPLPLLSHLAARCEGMELGTAVLVLPFFHPLLVAEAMAFLDAATGGASFLGVAAGWNASEFAALGIPRERRLARLREGVEVIERLWTGAEVHYHGEEYRLEGVTLSLTPVQRPRPPIWLGASSERVATRVAGLGDALVLSSHVPVSGLERQLQAYREERRRLGAPPPADVPVLRNVFVGEDDRSALEEALPYLEASYGRFQQWGLVEADLHERVLVGGPERVADGLRSLRERLGATKVLLRMQWYGMPSEVAERSLRRFGERVAPELSAEVG
jgi:alkanesulfonate monooxygenase SsuD/methylene tetrahydromethanopterin reductase-like flavin-dependent oxidoreductase (luciferase family)